MCTQQQGQKSVVSGQIAMLVVVAVCSGSRREYCLERAQSKHEQQQVMVLFTFVTLPTEAALNNTTVYNLQSKVRYNFTKKREASCQKNPSYIQCLFFQMTASCGFFYMNVRIVDRKGRTCMYVCNATEGDKKAQLNITTQRVT